MKINITEVKETINQASSPASISSSPASISSSPAPLPLTPKTQEESSLNLCYAPKIKKKETKTTEEFRSFKLD